MIERYEVIWSLIQKHGYRFDYRTVNDIQNKAGLITYICPVHGKITQNYHNHLSGKICLKCSYEARSSDKRMTIDKVIRKCKGKGIELDKYDLSEASIIIDDNKRTRIADVKCNVCGHVWNPLAITFTKGHGCPKCSGKIKDDEEIRRELSILHPELDFSKTNYSDKDKKGRLKVICPKHGEILVTYWNLRNGQGCYRCGREASAKKKTLSQEEFIRRALLTHNAKDVDYSNTVYKGMNKDIEVLCKKCGKTYKQIAYNHLLGCGCPECAMKELSKSETLFFNKVREMFPDAIHGHRDKNIFGKQSIDVFIPSINVGLEFQGTQHFEENHFDKLEPLSVTIERDLRKIRICEENGIRLYHFTTFKVPKDFKLYKVYTDFDELIRVIKSERDVPLG